MKFKTGPKKRIQFGFGNGGLSAQSYKDVVGHYHTGVDYKNGYGESVISDNFGIVYKINRPEASPSGWCGVYYLVPDGTDWVEVCQGHLSKVYVEENDLIQEGDEVGEEGNKGEVYYNGIRITKEMQEAGDRRGSHVHEQFRPVKSVKKVNSKKHYLNKDGKKYRDLHGNYFEIKFDNDTNGCVNPYTYLVEKNSLPVEWVKKLINLIRT